MYTYFFPSHIPMYFFFAHMLTFKSNWITNLVKWKKYRELFLAIASRIYDWN